MGQLQLIATYTQIKRHSVILPASVEWRMLRQQGLAELIQPVPARLLFPPGSPGCPGGRGRQLGRTDRGRHTV